MSGIDMRPSSREGETAEGSSRPNAAPVTVRPPSLWMLVSAGRVPRSTSWGVTDEEQGLDDLDDPASTASLASGILRYRTLQGRTYHSEMGNAQYW